MILCSSYGYAGLRKSFVTTWKHCYDWTLSVKFRLTNPPQDLGEAIKAIAVILGPVAKTPAAEKLLEAAWKAPGRR